MRRGEQKEGGGGGQYAVLRNGPVGEHGPKEGRTEQGRAESDGADFHSQQQEVQATQVGKIEEKKMVCRLRL